MSFDWIEEIEAETRVETDYAKTGSYWSLVLKPENLVSAAQAIKDRGYFIEDVSVYDVEEGFNVSYHFDKWEESARVTVNVMVPHDNPVLPSICSVYDGAEWHERESSDFYGVVFEGNPNPIPLLLSPEMEAHPLVKDAKKRTSISNILNISEQADSEPAEEAE